MTTSVAELIKQLQALPPDLPVILSKDGEGNRSSPFADLGQSMYVAESTYSGETYPTPEEIADRDDMSQDEDGAPDDAVRVVVLWPVN